MTSRTPRKPDISPSALVFDHGSLELRVDSIPRKKTEQELEVGKRFVQALSRHMGGDASLVRQPDDRADLIINIGSANEIEVQLTEFRDVKSRLIEMRRQYYEERMRSVLRESPITSTMRYRITIWADDLARDLPHTKDQEQPDVVRYLCENIVEACQRGNGEHFFSGTSTTGWRRHCILITVRAAPPGSMAPSVSWPIARSYATDELLVGLSNAINRKTAKLYQAPDGDFWLVIYSVDYSIHEFDLTQPDILNAVRQSKTAFTRLWYLHLRADDSTAGALVELHADDEPNDLPRGKPSRRVAWTTQEMARSAWVQPGLENGSE